jgi:hypothetical protein
VIVIYLPLTLAFSNYGEPVWQFVIDLIIIVLFIIDLILNFFTAYYDKREIVIVDKHKVIYKFSLTLSTENS